MRIRLCLGARPLDGIVILLAASHRHSESGSSARLRRSAPQNASSIAAELLDNSCGASKFRVRAKTSNFPTSLTHLVLGSCQRFLGFGLVSKGRVEVRQRFPLFRRFVSRTLVSLIDVTDACAAPHCASRRGPPPCVVRSPRVSPSLLPRAMVFLDEIVATDAEAGSGIGASDVGSRALLVAGEATRLEGNKAFRDGDVASAVVLYTQSLAETPPHSAMAGVVLGNRSAAYLALGRKSEAIDDAEHSVRLSPVNTPYAAKSRFRLGNACVANGRLEDAREAYRDALKQAPSDRAILIKLKEVSEKILDAKTGSAPTGEAKRTASTQASVPTPSSYAFSSDASSSSTRAVIAAGVARQNEANRLFRDGKYLEAIDIYDELEKTVTLLERPHALYSNRSAALIAVGRYKDAIKDARTCMRLEPRYAKGRYRLGTALLKAAIAEGTGDSAADGAERGGYHTALEAREVFTAGLALAPHSPEFKRGLDDIGVLIKSLEDAWMAPVEEETTEVVPVSKKRGETIATSDSIKDHKKQADNIIDMSECAEVDKADVTCGEPAVPFMTSSTSSVSSAASSASSISKSAKKKARKKRAKAAAAATVAALASSDHSACSNDWVMVSPNSPDKEAQTKADVHGLMPPLIPFEVLTCDDDLSPLRAALRSAVREHGCVGIRLPTELCKSWCTNVDGDVNCGTTGVGVLGEAGEAAAAFFALDPIAKAGHKPISISSRHGYRTPRDARRHAILGVNIAKPAAVKKDEEDCECFIVGNEYESDYPWPGSVQDFKQRMLDAHVTLQRLANKAGEVLMSGLVEMNEEFDKLADDIGLSHMFARTTFVHHPAPESEPRDGGAPRDGEFDAYAATTAAAVVGASTATPEPTLLTLIPCVVNGNGTNHGGTISIRSATTRVQLPGRPPMLWPPPSADPDDFQDVVLVVAGEWMSKITKREYPAPAVSHERGTGMGAYIHATYRA